MRNNRRPPWLDDLSEMIAASGKGVAAVLKTQAILAAVTFVLLCIGLALLDVPLWGLIAAGITLFDLVPLVGSGMIMIPWAVITLIAGNRQQALLLLVVYVVIFVVRQILDPVLNGKAIGVKPLYTLLCTVLATLLFGPWGLVLGSVAAIVLKTAWDIRVRRRREKTIQNNTREAGPPRDPDDPEGGAQGPV
ncbi:MAG: AI-2E family transporter [Clostridiaceae bacterium]|nr:AI-2E family transporter [Clostridiaceae bacterium]